MVVGERSRPSGGGKDLFAEAGGKDATKLPGAMAKLKETLGG